MFASLLIIAIQNQLTNYIGVRIANEIFTASLISDGSFHWQESGTWLLGILKTENTVLVVAGALIIVRWIKPLSEQAKILSGTLLFTVGFFALTFLKNPWMLILAMFTATVGELVYTPVQQSLLGRLAPEASRSVYMGMYQITMYLSEIIAGAFIIMGSFLGSFTIALVILIMGGVAAICFIMTLRIASITESPVSGDSTQINSTL